MCIIFFGRVIIVITGMDVVNDILYIVDVYMLLYLLVTGYWNIQLCCFSPVRYETFSQNE